MNDFMKNLQTEALNSALGDATHEDIESTFKMLSKYLYFIKDDKDRKEKAMATMDFFAFITATSVMLDMRDLESEEAN